MIQATIKDRDTVVNILYSSFVELRFPNSINFVVKQDRKRDKRLRYLMEYQFDVAIKVGEIWLSEDRQGCVLILPDEKKKKSPSLLMLDLKLALQCIGLSNVPKVMRRETLLKRNHPTEPYIYLWIMAVVPSAINRGVGGKLLLGILNHYKRLQKPYYLETTTEANLKFYTKYGFKVIGQEKDLDYPLYYLKRD